MFGQMTKPETPKTLIQQPRYMFFWEYKGCIESKKFGNRMWDDNTLSLEIKSLADAAPNILSPISWSIIHF